MVQKLKNLIPARGSLIPLTSAQNLDRTVEFAKKWEKAGNTHIEILLRTDNSIAAVEILSSETDLVVAAGTVLSVDQLNSACDVGADLIITPGLSETLLTQSERRGRKLIPGVQTPSEIMHAMELGLSTLKFFPASLNGPKHIESFASIFPSISFIPTGGITRQNFASYMSLPNVVATGGSWMIDDFEA